MKPAHNSGYDDMLPIGRPSHSLAVIGHFIGDPATNKDTDK